MKKIVLFRIAVTAAFALIFMGQGSAGISVDIKPYGYIKADMAWDRQATSHGNFVLYVKPVPNKKAEEFNMTAKQTRLGVWIENTESPDIKVRGRVEVDGYGSGTTENKGHLMLRHVYIEVASKFGKLIAGQTSDVIAPLVATTLNYTVGWGIGNIGYRRPQVRVATTLADKISVALAAVRPIGEDLDVVAANDKDGIDDGKTSGAPHYQGRMGVSLPHLEIGVSGHYGRLKARNAATTGEMKYETKSMNADIKIPFKNLLVKGEVFSGENLNTYFGSILNADTFSGVRSKGGWMDAAYKLTPKVKVVGGLGKERVNEKDIPANAREANRFVFGNLQFTADHGVLYGIEVSQFKTDYKNAANAKSTRIQASGKYSF